MYDKDKISSYTASLGKKVIDAAYLTLEGMIIYNCESFPSGGGTEFSQNILQTKDGALKDVKWTPEIRHSECSQAVDVISSDDVKL